MTSRRIAFLGQKPIGAECLKVLINFFGASSISFVLTNLVSEGWWQDCKVNDIAKSNQIRVFEQGTTTQLELFDLLDKYNVDTLISVQYPKILSKPVLSQINYQAFNLHLAKLPEYRGWHSASHAILNGDKIFGVTIHKIDQDIDSGEIICERFFEILNECTVGELYYQSEIHGINLFKNFCEKLILNDTHGKQQIGNSRYYDGKSLRIRLSAMGDQKPASRASDFTYRRNNTLY
jgi:methionyl-tRNA formyltransferase